MLLVEGGGHSEPLLKSVEASTFSGDPHECEGPPAQGTYSSFDIVQMVPSLVSVEKQFIRALSSSLGLKLPNTRVSSPESVLPHNHLQWWWESCSHMLKSWFPFLFGKHIFTVPFADITDRIQSACLTAFVLLDHDGINDIHKTWQIIRSL